MSRTRTELIDALRLLAGRARPIDGDTAARLDDVADAVAGVSPTQWRGLDLSTVVEPERLLRASQRRGRILRLAEHTRDLVMLLPILITWSGVGLAVAAYDAYTNQHTRQDAQQSFLYLWETGLGNHWYFRLSTVAIADAGAILVIIVLLAVVPLADWLRNGGRRRVAEALAHEVGAALAEAAIFLNGPGAAEPVTIPAVAQREAAIAREITGGAELARPVEAMARAIGRLTTRLEEFAKEQSELNRSMAATLEELRGTAGVLTAGFEELRRAAETFARGEETFLREIGRQIAAQAEVATRLREVSTPLGETLNGTREYAAELRRFVEHLRVMDDTLLRFQKESHQLQFEGLQQLRSAAEHVRQQVAPPPPVARPPAADRGPSPNRAQWVREDSP